tara:strand:+ start:225 stop:764 length:540 start_codon:yes stop_codon:yes gene_type:complete
MKLIEIKKNTFNVILDLKYAGKDNILGKVIFHENRCFLLEEAAKKLLDATTIAKDLGYYFKIFDAYRPSYVQEALWEFDPNPNFLSDPKKGSPHTKGIAIDLTLVDSNGNELDMGTKFDDFTKNSYHLSKDLEKEVRVNRRLLLSIMTLAGFDFYHKEWWHYQLYNASNYPLIKNYFDS